MFTGRASLQGLGFLPLFCRGVGWGWFAGISVLSLQSVLGSELVAVMGSQDTRWHSGTFFSVLRKAAVSAAEPGSSPTRPGAGEAHRPLNSHRGDNGDKEKGQAAPSPGD